MFEHTPSARMQLVGLGELLHPASCMVCGNGNHNGGYVHLGVFFDYEGTMYLCSTCLSQAAEIIGCLVPDEAKHLRAVSDSVAAENARLTSELEAANDRLRTYDSLLSGLATTAPVSSDFIVSPSSPDSKSTAAAVSDATDAGESVAEKPVTVRRRGNAARNESGDITAAAGPSL